VHELEATLVLELTAACAAKLELAVATSLACPSRRAHVAYRSSAMTEPMPSRW